MGQQPKSQFNVYLPINLQEALREYSDETGIPLSRLTEDAVRMLLKERTGKEYPR